MPPETPTVFPMKRSHRAQPLGPLPSGKMFAVAVEDCNVVWAAGERGLWRGSLSRPFALTAYSEEMVEQPSSLRVLRMVGGVIVELSTVDGAVFRYFPDEEHWMRGFPEEPAAAFSGRKPTLLLPLHKGAWLAVVEGTLCLVADDGFVEPLPTDLARPPVQDVTKAVAGPDGSVWLASRAGVCQLRNGKWEYFAGKRWLNSDEVNDIAVDPQGRAWIATTEGLCCIEYEPVTLAEKALHFETVTRRRHIRLGYCCANTLRTPGAVDDYIHQASDNDGLWTAIYVAAESFRYAVTGEAEARQFARESALAMCWLEQVTPVPGLIARAAVRHDEEVERSGGEWHESSDAQWLWKGDASSDELDGHYFAYSVYYDLAADADSAQTVATTVARITDHLIDHGYFLVDVDGEPTNWGFFAPAWLNVTREDQRGLNSLEMLAYLRTAYHICGHSRYMEHYWELVERHHYALNALNQKILWPGEVNFSDDELAFLCYYPLLKYEDDPVVRQMYLLSLERQWQAVRPQRCPLWNVI
ncbi:MAG: hypothetical protein H5T86_14590, partial [Armatimonadetes bacterium]|nr:hypothetical protein [Armatimonadota bacterium]